MPLSRIDKAHLAEPGLISEKATKPIKNVNLTHPSRSVKVAAAGLAYWIQNKWPHGPSLALHTPRETIIANSRQEDTNEP